MVTVMVRVLLRTPRPYFLAALEMLVEDTIDKMQNDLDKKGTAIRCIGLLHMTYQNYDPDRTILKTWRKRYDSDLFF